MVDPFRLVTSHDPFLSAVGGAYQNYTKCLLAANRVDFAHLQRLAYDMLDDPATAGGVSSHLRYVMVDEYQDTNYIQEQLLMELTKANNNLCVVGDEDQSLYRFRGATVRNILEFPQRVPDCVTINLTTNYRSHRAIVERYDRWMNSADWSNPDGDSFRHDKKIVADSGTEHPDYPSVISIWGSNDRDEAERFADMVEFLKEKGVIEDYSQVALLLHSVRDTHSGRYLKALQARGIPAFCPRARAFFEIPEISRLVGCYAVLFGWHGDGRGQARGAVWRLANYVDESLIDLAGNFDSTDPLARGLQEWKAEIDALREGETLDLRPVDYFYRLLARTPFKEAIRNENTARNLASSPNFSTPSKPITTTRSSLIETAGTFAFISSAASCVSCTRAASTSMRTLTSLSPRGMCR